MHSNILLDIAADLCSPLLCYKAAKATNVDVFTLGQGVFHFFEHGLQCNQDINLRYTCFFRYLVNEVCLSHVMIFYGFSNFKCSYSQRQSTQNQLITEVKG